MNSTNRSLHLSDSFSSQYDENGDILERIVEGCESEISCTNPLDSRFFQEPLASSTLIHGSQRYRSHNTDPLASSTMMDLSEYSSNEDSGRGSSVCTFSISDDLEDSLVDDEYLQSLHCMYYADPRQGQTQRRTSTRADLLVAPLSTPNDTTTAPGPCCAKVGFKNPMKAIKKIFKSKKNKEYSL